MIWQVIARDKIVAVTMPCFGTTDRTYNNACTLVHKLGATLKEVDIRPAVNQHFKDIEHDPEVHDVTYENSQARERTQVLMDIANQSNGMVIGTGDLSELALGWATYNGDHMSMYAVNASIPKTLVRHLVKYYADTCGDAALEEVLLDILDTPVSPELIAAKGRRRSHKKRKTLWVLMSCMISSCIIFCDLAADRQRFTDLQNMHFQVFMMRLPFINGLKNSIGDFSHSSLNVPACRMARRSEQWPYHQEAICVCQVMRL